MIDRCPSCGVSCTPRLFPCLEQGCPFEAPKVWKDCESCGGEGGYEKHIRVYEQGCGFAHDDSTWVECEECHGRGGSVWEIEGDA